jgi:hypothetical protein
MIRLATGLQGLSAMGGRGGPQADKFMLWVDAVGGFWVCMADVVSLGQPVRSGTADIPILADISSRHARIRRDGEGYVIEAVREVRVDGKPVREMGWLGNGSKIELGEGVRLVFRRPHALSATARIDFASHHRTQPSSDAVLLMADCCILGPKPQGHILCRQWPREVILYRHDEELYCRSAGGLEIDGVYHRERGPLTRNSRVVGEGFSLSLEAIESG